MVHFHFAFEKHHIFLTIQADSFLLSIKLHVGGPWESLSLLSFEDIYTMTMNFFQRSLEDGTSILISEPLQYYDEIADYLHRFP